MLNFVSANPNYSKSKKILSTYLCPMEDLICDIQLEGFLVKYCLAG